MAVLVVGNGSEIKPGLEALRQGPATSVDITIPRPQQASNQRTEKNQ
jgi:hypothetical protein